MADDESFRAFVYARWGALTRTAYLLTGDAHLAEDLLQTVLAKTAMRWRRVDTNPEAYVRRALYHEAVSWWRRRRVGEWPTESIPERPTDGGGLAFTEAADRRLMMQAALARLTVKQRAVLMLRFYEDYSETQAAEMLGCSVGTVKSQTRRALDRLRVLAPELADLVTTPATEDRL